MSKSRFSVFLSLLIVFLSGTMVGLLGYRWYSVSAASAEKGGPGQKGGPRDPAEVKRHIIADMTEAVKLTPVQAEEVGKILDNTRSQFEAVHHEMNARGKAIWQEQVDQINAILREDQRPLYQQLRDKHDREREARKNHAHGIQQDNGKK